MARIPEKRKVMARDPIAGMRTKVVSSSKVQGELYQLLGRVFYDPESRLVKILAATTGSRFGF